MASFSYELLGWGYWDWDLPWAKTEKQRKALSAILANVRVYQREPIALSMRNQMNRPSRYNYYRLGQKPLVTVLRNLEAANLVAIRDGTPRFARTPDGEELQTSVSFFTASEELVYLAFEWIRDNEFCRVDPIFLELKANNKESHLLNFEWDDYTRLVQKQMSEYCEYISHQHIMIEGKPLGQLKLVRQFKDWAGDGSFFYGGRAFEYFMGIPKQRRDRFRINGDKIVRVDYPASVPNLLYLMMTGERLSLNDDPYRLDGFDREVAKWAMKFLLNTKGLWGAELALNNWLNTEAENPEARGMIAQAIQKVGSSRMLLELVIERNEPIKDCLMLGAAMGQHYQWLEANLVFHVAHQLSLIGVPALTVHDEFIVREQDAELAEMVMYGTWPEDLPELPEAPWNRSRQTKSEVV